MPDHARIDGEAASGSVEPPGSKEAARVGLSAARGVLERLRAADWGSMVERMGQDFPPAVGSYGDSVELRAVCDEDGPRVLVTAWDQGTETAATAELGLEACWRLACSALAAIDWAAEVR